MLARNAYGTSLGENSYGGLGQPRKNPKAAQPMPAGTGLPGPEASQQGSGMNMSAYSPGRARPVPPPSQGTPFQAYAPQQQAGPNGGAMTPQGERWYSQSPVPAVSQSATGVNGQQFADPQQAFTQRDALIQRINESRAPMFAGAGTYLGDGAPPPTWGQKPPLDFNTLMGQANDMVAGGWQNPFAQQPPGPGGIRHWTDNPRYQQPQFQDLGPPPVAGTVDYSSRGLPSAPPDERFLGPPPSPGSARPIRPAAPGSTQWNLDREAAYRQQEADRLSMPRDQYLDRYVAGGASGQRAREAAGRQQEMQRRANSDYRRNTPLPQQRRDEQARRDQYAARLADYDRRRQASSPRSR